MKIYVLLFVVFLLYYGFVLYYQFFRKKLEKGVIFEGISFDKDEIIPVKKDMIIKIVQDEQEDTKVLFDFVCKISDLNSGRVKTDSLKTNMEKENVMEKEKIDFEKFVKF